MTTPSSLVQALRPEARTLPASGILKVFNYGRDRNGLIPLWAGESDTPTPEFICAAAWQALRNGETFYTSNRGIPDLRKAIADFTNGLYGTAASPDDFIVTSGGMQAIQLAVQAVVPAGAEVVVLSPAWPNFAGALAINGARVREVPLRFDRSGWSLDLDALFSAVTPNTRAVIINTPANPTGWTASEAELKAILAFCRSRKLWLIADEIYAQFVWNGPSLAPSFQTLREPSDRIIFVNTFSKNWAMTGWRLGWLQVAAELAPTFESLVQYNTSGAATFMQRAGVVAIREGRAFAAEQIARARAGRTILAAALADLPGIEYASPAGAFYSFFRVSGVSDSMQAALDIVDQSNVGLAPGIAFGASGEGFMRICFLRSADQLRESMNRLSRWFRARAASGT